MHGSNHACNELPMALIGSGGGTFKTDQHVEFSRRWLRDLHHTVMWATDCTCGRPIDA
jgi:hypothetical protein